MKKNLFAAIVACSALFAANAHAITVSLDDFNNGDQSLTAGAIGTLVSDTNAYRTLTTRLLSTAPPTQSAVEVSFGGLHVTNGGGEDSEVTVSWNLAAGLLPPNATNIGFLFTIVQSDANATDVEFLLNGASVSNFAIPGNTFDKDLMFSVADSVLDDGGTLTMVINGAVGWDLDLDFVGLSYDLPTRVNEVPEPASVALLGMGLLGLGAVRRRKA
ncbi:PEP-CTERM sorting domain-containing protein [Pseudorhodoferax sp.]|uniref:PEP-CTERM sorting domain-containing protein n=1 Tax=Pseudorhodoferax sp. TaxID=1993553 RepID=UPI002DD6562F|nr:PEP-CTERM sorting domain-containing protein [Pseudorhodoferax sp.]